MRVNLLCSKVQDNYKQEQLLWPDLYLLQGPEVPQLQTNSNIKQHTLQHVNPTPLAQNYLEQHFELSARLDTTDAESITNRLLFASEHLKERYRLADDNHETTTPEAISSLSIHPSASR